MTPPGESTSSSLSSREVDTDAERETTDNICSALFFLRKLSPQHPEYAPTPFQLLHLDPHSKPFHPAAHSAHAGAPLYGLVRTTVQEALVKVRASVWERHLDGNEGATAVVEALWHVGHMLTDDATRLQFLDRVQPRLEASFWHQSDVAAAKARTKAVTELCRPMWSRRAWEWDK